MRFFVALGLSLSVWALPPSSGLNPALPGNHEDSFPQSPVVLGSTSTTSLAESSENPPSSTELRKRGLLEKLTQRGEIIDLDLFGEVRPGETPPEITAGGLHIRCQTRYYNTPFDYDGLTFQANGQYCFGLKVKNLSKESKTVSARTSFKGRLERVFKQRTVRPDEDAWIGFEQSIFWETTLKIKVRRVVMQWSTFGIANEIPAAVQNPQTTGEGRAHGTGPGNADTISERPSDAASEDLAGPSSKGHEVGHVTRQSDDLLPTRGMQKRGLLDLFRKNEIQLMLVAPVEEHVPQTSSFDITIRCVTSYMRSRVNNNGEPANIKGHFCRGLNIHNYRHRAVVISAYVYWDAERRYLIKPTTVYVGRTEFRSFSWVPYASVLMRVIVRPVVIRTAAPLTYDGAQVSSM